MACNNTKDKELLAAVRSGNFERFQVLLSEGANINVTDICGNSLLHLSQNRNITKALLRHGLSVNVENCLGEPPLNFVVKRGGGKTVVEELLKYGADISYTDRDGKTPIHTADEARTPSKEVITYLVKYGANSYTKNWHSRLYDNYDLHLLHLHFCNFQQLLIKYSIVKKFSEYQKEVDSIAEDGSSNESRFVSDCAAEILQMKTHILLDDISLFDVVENAFSFESLFSKPKESLHIPTTRYSVPRRYVHCGNKLSMKLKNIDFSNFSMHYPIYNEVILDAIKPYVIKANLLDKLKMVDFYTELDPIDQVDLTTNKVDKTVQVGFMPRKMNIKANSVLMDDQANALESDVVFVTNQVDVNQSDGKNNQVGADVNQSKEKTDPEIKKEVDIKVDQSNVENNETDLQANEIDVKANQAVVRRVTLNYLCVYRISEYLSKDDLLNFIMATYVPNNSTLVNDGAKPDATRALEDSVNNPTKRARLE